jgi:di/tricarboxylate transporter
MVIVFITIAAALGMFMWGKVRYDLVALLALFVVVVFGIIPAETAFKGFAHPAVITVASVMIISQGLQNSGLIDTITRRIARKTGNNALLQIILLTGITAIASGFMNNVGALAIMMPVAVNLVRKSGRSPSFVLMPIAFASLLGGMMTLIGTPPNIIIATYRQEAVGEAFRMFDYLPVGAGVVVVGLLFIALIGWRLIPHREAGDSQQTMFDIEDYVTEVIVKENSKLRGKRILDLRKHRGVDVNIICHVRGEKRCQMPSPETEFLAGDVLIIEADSDSLKNFLDVTGFTLAGGKEIETGKDTEGKEVIVKEVVVMKNSRLVGRTATGMDLRNRFGINLLALARHDWKIRKRLGLVRFAVGDVLLLQGRKTVLDDTISTLGCLPLAERGLRIGFPPRVLLALSIFVVSIIAVVAGFLPVQISFAIAAVVFVLTKLIPVREAYEDIDWSVIVLLAAMIQLGSALKITGGTELVANSMVHFAGKLPLWVMMIGIMIVTLALANVINTAATSVLMAPIGIVIAQKLGISIDPILMCIAVATSCPFMTPIGHQSNILVMTPGGYKFGDYWKMGLPLTILVIAVSVPLILLVWKP